MTITRFLLNVAGITAASVCVSIVWHGRLIPEAVAITVAFALLLTVVPAVWQEVRDATPDERIDTATLAGLGSLGVALMALGAAASWFLRQP
jgi:hypothetical protein